MILRKLFHFIPPIILVMILAAGIYAFKHIDSYRDARQAITYEVKDIDPKAPQDYILLGKKININTATAEILQTLPGIGPKLANEIIAHRSKHGRFRSVESLDDVKGVGPAKLEKVREFVVAK